MKFWGKIKLVGVAAGIALLIFGGAVTLRAAIHSHHHGPSMMFGDDHEQYMADALGLSDQQKAQVATLKATEKTRIEPLHKELMQAYQEIDAASSSGSFDETKIRQIVNDHVSAFTEFVVARARFKSEFYKVLTPDQQAKLNTMHQHMKDKMNGHSQGSEQKR